MAGPDGGGAPATRPAPWPTSTRSYVAVMDEGTRVAVLDGVRDLLAGHPGTRGRAVLDLPYRTAACRLTPR